MYTYIYIYGVLCIYSMYHHDIAVVVVHPSLQRKLVDAVVYEEQEVASLVKVRQGCHEVVGLLGYSTR